MKILVRTTGNTDAGQRAIDNGGFSIPNTTVTWLSVIYLVITILSNSLSSFIAGTPQRNSDNNNYEMRKQNFELQLMQRVLEISNDTDRRSSLQLLTNASFFKNRMGIQEFINTHPYIPKWPQRTLEAFNTYAGTQGFTNPGQLTYPVNSTVSGTNNTNNNQLPNPQGGLPRRIDSTKSN